MRPIDGDILLEQFKTLRDNLDTKSATHRAVRGAFVDCILRTKEAPTVDAAPVKHGYWIAVANGRIKNWKQKCSCCGFYGRGLPPYCKMCGAKMDLKDGEP